MNKEYTLHIRLSEEDVEALDYCKSKLNKSRAEIIRQSVNSLKGSIERVLDTSKKYLYKISKKDGSVISMELCDRKYLVTLLANDMSVPDNVREATANTIADQIDKGVAVVLESQCVLTYKLATPEEAEKAKEMMSQDAKEDANIQLPDCDTLMEISGRVDEKKIAHLLDS